MFITNHEKKKKYLIRKILAILLAFTCFEMRELYNFLSHRHIRKKHFCIEKKNNERNITFKRTQWLSNLYLSLSISHITIVSDWTNNKEFNFLRKTRLEDLTRNTDKHLRCSLLHQPPRKCQLIKSLTLGTMTLRQQRVNM